MALFKISKGQSKNLPKTYNEGYAYFTTDDGKFYIDTSDSADGRIGLNAFQSDEDRLGNIIDETYITTSDEAVVDGPAPLLDADTLNGKTADDFVLKSDNINVGDAESLGGLPASDYVTFDDIDTEYVKIDSNNESLIVGDKQIFPPISYNQIVMPDGARWDGEVSSSSSSSETYVQSDWNINDVNNSSYIKNRPFYDNRGNDYTIVDNITFEIINSSDGHTTDYLFDISKPNITVIIDGETYQLSYDPEIGGGITDPFNPIMWFGEATAGDYIFRCYKYNNSLDQLNIEGPVGTHTLTVIQSGELVQIEDKFIPNTIARVNDIYYTTMERIYFTVPASDWTQTGTGRYTQTIAIDGITSNSTCYHLDLDMTSVTEDTITTIKEAWSFIDNAETADGGILLTCFTQVPTVDLSLIADVQKVISNFPNASGVSF